MNDSLSSDFQKMISGFPLSIGNYTLGLANLKTEPNALDHIPTYKQKAEANFKRLDKKMTSLLMPYDDLLLTSWANWMRSCIGKLNTLDKNLAFIGKKQWLWEEVIEAMAFLTAIQTDVQVFLLIHNVDSDED